MSRRERRLWFGDWQRDGQADTFVIVRDDEDTDLTGAEAQRAAQAALGKFPGQIERVTRGPGGGGYVVHVFTPDGYEVHVFIDPGFHVQGSDQSGGGPGPGPNTLGPGGTTQ